MTQVRIAPHLLALLLTASAVVCSPAMASTQWKWRDTNGSIQYSDRPPPQGTPDSAILTRPRSSSMRVVTPPLTAPSGTEGQGTPVAPAAPKASDPELEAKRRKAEDEKLAQQKAEEAKVAKQRAENCSRARDYQRTLDNGMRIARVNGKGEREILDDKARADEQRRNQETMQANCQ